MTTEIDNNTLEWAAQWLEGSIKGENNERVREFAGNMAMTFRAAKTDTRTPATSAAPIVNAKFVPPAEDALHIAICQAVQEHHGPTANAILRTALNDYKPTRLTRTELIRVQQRSRSGEVTTVMISPAAASLTAKQDCKRAFPCRFEDARQCARDTKLGSDCPTVCRCACHVVAKPSGAKEVAEEIVPALPQVNDDYQVRLRTENVERVAAIIERHFPAAAEPVASCEHSWVGAGDYGGETGGLMCAGCGMDFGDFCATQDIAAAVVTEDRPKIICLCGSTRFIEQFAIKTWELERQGFIVLGCTLLPMWYCNVSSHFGEATGTKEQCDELHKRKIDLADKVLVLNIGGYIGESTASEIAYAERLGKLVHYLEPTLATPAGMIPVTCSECDPESIVYVRKGTPIDEPYVCTVCQKRALRRMENATNPPVGRMRHGESK